MAFALKSLGEPSQVEPLSNILIRRVGELVQESDDHRIPRESLVENILRGDVRREGTRALHLYPILKDAYMDVVVHLVVAVDNGLFADEGVADDAAGVGASVPG